MIRNNTLTTQGKEITPNKLLQRADKAERYDEFNELQDVVLRAYTEITKAARS